MPTELTNCMILVDKDIATEENKLMEEITLTAVVPFTLGDLKLMTSTTAVLMLNPAIEGCQSFHVGLEDHTTEVSTEVKENQIGAGLISEMVFEGDSNVSLTESHNKRRNEDEFKLAKDFRCMHNPSSQSAASDKSSPCWEESAILTSKTANTIRVDDNIHVELSLTEPHVELEPKKIMASSVVMKLGSKDGSKSDGPDPKPCAEVHVMPEKQTCRTSCHNALQLSSTPLWGMSSVCGRREYMEDAVSVKPQLFQVPSLMLMDDHVNEITKHSAAHFFGVYDGHGGCQVANYCQNRLHSVLIEEIESAESSLSENNGKDGLQDRWIKVFSNCFHKVDDEIGRVHADDDERNRNDGSESSIEETLAPETVGSTALVAILTQTHIIVANCGDSRAVLCRGKEPLPLSDDHKPHRDDEWARIEDSGGKIIQWNGYRVLGVLAVSRSIGDRYLKPWIISDPEVKCVLLEKNDECLILASDGLWDVMTNEEACDIARKRILLWHKKNGSNVPTGPGHVVDPAAQYAAEHLSRLALQRGSKDNISVIVIDLKAQRQFKRKV